MGTHCCEKCRYEEFEKYDHPCKTCFRNQWHYDHFKKGDAIKKDSEHYHAIVSGESSRVGNKYFGE